jgi:hypothetical protein
LGEPIELPGPPASPVEGKWAVVGFAALLFAVVGLTYQPSLKHVARADQVAFLLDTIDCDGFLDTFAHCYSYNRTRVISPGDTQLFRPVFFALVSAEKALFADRFELWQAAAVMLHWAACVLLLLVLLRVRSLAAGGSPSPSRRICDLLPYALTLFFALNHAVVEQVIWFNISGYVLCIVFILGSLLALLHITGRAESTRGQRATRLAAAWVLTLLAAFTYEIGQFYALLAGAFLAAGAFRRGRVGRAVGLFALFLSVSLVYQAVNAFDRRLHRGQFVDDVSLTDIGGRCLSVTSLEHLARYVVFAIVQPFLPLSCKCQMMPLEGRDARPGVGKMWLGEQVWQGDLAMDGPLAVSLTLFGLWAGLTAQGTGRLVKVGNKKLLAVSLFGFGVCGLHVGIIVFGRMNLRTEHLLLALNPYYSYFTLLFALIGSLPPLLSLGCRGGLFGASAERLAGALLLAGLVCLGVCGGCQTHKINRKAARLFAPFRSFHQALRTFVEGHRGEEDFSLAIHMHPPGSVPGTRGLPWAILFYKKYIRRTCPKYVVWWESGQLKYAPAREWDRSHSSDRESLCPDLIRICRHHFVFHADGWYYATPHGAPTSDFLSARNRSDCPGLLKARSVESLTRQISSMERSERATTREPLRGGETPRREGPGPLDCCQWMTSLPSFRPGLEDLPGDRDAGPGPRPRVAWRVGGLTSRYGARLMITRVCAGKVCPPTVADLRAARRTYPPPGENSTTLARRPLACWGREPAGTIAL